MNAAGNCMGSNPWRMENWMLKQLDIHKSYFLLKCEWASLAGFGHHPNWNEMLVFSFSKRAKTECSLCSLIEPEMLSQKCWTKSISSKWCAVHKKDACNEWNNALYGMYFMHACFVNMHGFHPIILTWTIWMSNTRNTLRIHFAVRQSVLKMMDHVNYKIHFEYKSFKQLWKFIKIK